jgi:hypothetical protein
VLRPGGTFVGVDSLQSLLMTIFHIRDTMMLIDPAGLPARLEFCRFPRDHHGDQSGAISVLCTTAARSII